MPSFSRDRIGGLIGNILEHYDHALFALLAPFIAPYFFEGQEPLTALILTYGILPIGLLTKPIGALFFGWIGDRIGRREALCYSLLGMGLATAGMGCLPLYREAGIWSPLLLTLGKMLQSFFAAGETTGGAIFLLERSSPAKRSLFSSFYGASTMIGILLASGLVSLLSSYEIIEQGWRFLFFFGSLTAFIGVFLRFKKEEQKTRTEKLKFQLEPSIFQYKKVLFSLIITSGFSSATYALSFTLMNGFVPLITSIPKTELMKMNTFFLVIDMLLLPCFGMIANKLGKERLMILSALFLSLGALPLFSLLNSSTIWTIAAVRLTIITLGVAFAAPYHAWALEKVPSPNRYTILSLGNALGSQLIGAPAVSICLWFYKQTNSHLAPGIYLMAIAALAAYIIQKEKKLISEIPLPD